MCVCCCSSLRRSRRSGNTGKEAVGDDNAKGGEKENVGTPVAALMEDGYSGAKPASPATPPANPFRGPLRRDNRAGPPPRIHGSPRFPQAPFGQHLLKKRGGRPLPDFEQ